MRETERKKGIKTKREKGELEKVMSASDCVLTSGHINSGSQTLNIIKNKHQI